MPTSSQKLVLEDIETQTRCVRVDVPRQLKHGLWSVSDETSVVDVDIATGQ